MLKLKLNESTNLAFEMIVEGSATKVDMTWLVLETKSGFEIRLPAEHIGNEVRCSIPILEGILPNGKTTAHLEVIIDGRFYRPITEEVELGSGKEDIRIITRPIMTESPASQPKSGSLYVRLSQMKKWKVDQDNVKYYDNIMKSKGKIKTLDTRPYMEYLNDFGIFYTTQTNESDDFTESLEKIDQLKHTLQNTTGNVAEEYEFGKSFEEKYLKMTEESDAKLKAIREAAKQFVESTIPAKNSVSSMTEMNKLKALIQPK